MGKHVHFKHIRIFAVDADISPFSLTLSAREIKTRTSDYYTGQSRSSLPRFFPPIRLFDKMTWRISQRVH